MVLGIAYKIPEWIAKAAHLLAQIKAKAIRNPYAYAYWNMVALRDYYGYQVVSCSKSQFEKVKFNYQSAFHHFMVEEKEEIVDNAKQAENKGTFLLICNKESCDKINFPSGGF